MSLWRILGGRPLEGCVTAPETSWGTAALMCACACAGGEVELQNAVPEWTAPVGELLSAMGCRVDTVDRSVRIRCRQRLLGGNTVIVRENTGVSPLILPLLMAACLRSGGTTVFVDAAASEPYRFTEGMSRLGAHIRTQGRVAVVTGVETLRGARLMASDPHECAALVLAGLAAQGETRIIDKGLLTRQYKELDGGLRRLGAEIIDIES